MGRGATTSPPVLVYVINMLLRQRFGDDLHSAAHVVTAYEAARAATSGAYPVEEPNGHGLLDIGDGQRLYWETFGNRHGVPAVVLHGGPGSGSHRSWVGMFDLTIYQVVLFDQRGCGRSTPDAAELSASLATNTTRHLVDDLERLRAHLRIERWLVLGVSWGTTLGLAYAQRHPEPSRRWFSARLTGTTRREVDWITRGMARFLPEEWEHFAAAVPRVRRRGNFAKAYARLLARRTSPTVCTTPGPARSWCSSTPRGTGRARTQPG